MMSLIPVWLLWSHCVFWACHVWAFWALEVLASPLLHSWGFGGVGALVCKGCLRTSKALTPRLHHGLVSCVCAPLFAFSEASWNCASLLVSCCSCTCIPAHACIHTSRFFFLLLCYGLSYIYIYIYIFGPCLAHLNIRPDQSSFNQNV